MLALVLSAWGWVKGGVSSLFGVLARYPWPCACVALAIIAGWQWHEKDRAKEELPVWQKAFATEQGAFRTEQQTAHNLVAQIESQNASITTLAQTSDNRAKAAKSALGAATARGAALEAQSRQIDANALHGAYNCRTPDGVMKVKGEL